MKKVFFLAASLFAASFASAQEANEAQSASSDLKPSAGTFTTEVSFCPFVSESVSLENGRLNASYFISDNFAVRAGLGFGYTSRENEDTDYTETTTSFSFAPGVAYYLDGTKKFSPYVGGELVIATSGTEIEAGNSSYDTEDSFRFGVQAFTGMNYYFSEGLYVGVEFGLGINSVSTETAPAAPNSEKTEISTTSLKVYAQPAIRLGWAF